MLLVDADRIPTVEIVWEDQSGSRTRYAGSRAYAIDSAREPLGGNIEAYAAVGGTRLTKGAGHPQGAVLRFGFYKTDNAKPWFTSVGPDTRLTATISGVWFNQPAEIQPTSVVQHLKYDLGAMESCGIPGDAREQFNTADRSDTLNDRVRDGVDARLGALDGTDESLGSARVEFAEDGSATVSVTFAYAALRNLRDPWQSDLPGTFLEPFHFHIEFEALPAGTPPLDPTRPRDPASIRAD